jgi:hypothetical protein
MIERSKGFVVVHKRKILPALISLSLLAGLVVSIVETQGAQADYYLGCGYGYNSSGNFGYGSSYGYGYGLNHVYGYGNGDQVCPASSGGGGGGGGGGATTTTTSPTTTTTLPTTTTTAPKSPPSLLPLKLYFANNSAVLTKYDRNILDNLGSQVVSHQTSHLNFIGYASKIGTLPINYALSLARARVAEAYLVRLLHGRGYSSITFTVRGNGVLRTYANLALDRIVVVSA